VIAGGVLVEGMGGGTCQVASTLYAASFFAGLIVEDRQTHSRPSSYIKLGLDATVSYPDLDLKLKNPFDFPVAIHFVAEEGKLRAEIRGSRRLYTVTLLRKVIGQQPFATRIVEDPNLEAGKEVITQNGIPGYTVRRYQVVEADKVGYRFQTVDKYPPTSQYVHRGTAPRGSVIDAGKRPKPDNHKPYRASTYLRMVQGPEELWYEQTHE
jgi:vancomycin resistance protein YoaR